MLGLYIPKIHPHTIFEVERDIAYLVRNSKVVGHHSYELLDDTATIWGGRTAR